MSDKTILSLIPGFDEAMKSAGESLAHINAQIMGKELAAGEHLHPLNTQTMVLLAIVIGFVLTMTFLARSRITETDKAIVPDETLTPRTFVELLFDTVFGLMSDMMGRDNARRFFPLIATCAMVILFSNLLGLMPGMAPPTDNLNLNAAMASVIFIATHVVVFRTSGLAHFSHMANPPGEWWGWFLAPLMLPIEMIGHVVRPVSLSLRLMCNMIGDHQVLAIFLGLIAIPLIYPMPIMILGFVVCVVQTAVFCLLSMVYINLALEDLSHGHGEEGHH